jgi:DNA-binding PadR family transcriptional regulator
MTINNHLPYSTSKKMTQMRRGLLELAVLIIIDSARPAMRADEIMQKLSGTEFRSPPGTLYSIFSDFRRKNLVDNVYEEQDDSTARKCYYLTNKGNDLMIELRSYWNILDATLKQLNSPR